MRIVFIATLAMMASACTPNDVTAGGALKHDLALQTIDPQPTYKGTEMEGGSGTHAAKAMANYRGDTVKEAPTPITVNIGGGGLSK